MKSIILDNTTAKILGRTKLYGNTLWCGLSATGAEFVFTGKKLVIKIIADDQLCEGNDENLARFSVYVDGQRFADIMCDEKEKFITVTDSDVKSEHTVCLRKLSECAMSTIGIEVSCDDEGTCTPTCAKSHRIEIIGDSITCGYGADAENELCHFRTSTEDVTKSYSYKTCCALNADFQLFSASGYGIISGWCDEDTKVTDQLIPPIYKSFGQSFGKFAFADKPQKLSWDFRRFQPELCIINIGTNDESYCKSIPERENEYKENYTKFIKVVRECNPNAKILCILGIMGDNLFPRIEEAVSDYISQTNDTNISTFRCTVQQGERDGYGADWHPSVKTHNMAAEELVAQIKKVMGW